MLSVRGQRELASWLADLPVLMLDATRRIDDARRVFLDVDLTETPHVSPVRSSTVRPADSRLVSVTARRAARFRHVRHARRCVRSDGDAQELRSGLRRHAGRRDRASWRHRRHDRTPA